MPTSSGVSEDTVKNVSPYATLFWLESISTVSSLCVRQGIVEDIGIRNEPSVAMTEIFLGFTAQTAIGCPTVAQLTLFPGRCIYVL